MAYFLNNEAISSAEGENGCDIEYTRTEGWGTVVRGNVKVNMKGK